MKGQKMTMEDKIEELVEWNIESLADMFGGEAETLTDLEYKSLDKIFRFQGIIPFDKKSNDLIDLEYEEMVETKIKIRGWGRNDAI